MNTDRAYSVLVIAAFLVLGVVAAYLWIDFQAQCDIACGTRQAVMIKDAAGFPQCACF